MKNLLLAFIFGLLFFRFASPVLAEPIVAESSAITQKNTIPKDIRVKILQTFLRKQNSPLAEYAYEFILVADRYKLDWRLVPAISGVESTFGKKIPANSYNAYGWANGNYSFQSWKDSIEIVSRKLKNNYINKGAGSIAKIGKIYAPPSHTWVKKVKYFMRKIEPIPVEFTI